MRQPLTRKSKVGDVLQHPLGRDMLFRLSLQTGVAFSLIDNAFVRALPLTILKYVGGGVIDLHFIDAFLTLLNSEKATPQPEDNVVRPAWWKEAVIYQIYPSSFHDSNGDGLGDLAGITEKIPYLQTLGIDCIWLSPIFGSPFDDQGYDIADYKNIAERFGTLDDFTKLLETAHASGIKVVLDLVFNHTSDEHPWFVEALRDPSSDKRDYYFFREGETAPNNWTSFFSGSAWNHYPAQNVWALHLFSEKQMDLNWDNAKVRGELAGIASFWLDRGVDGFRLDVINYVSKAAGLPDGNPGIGKLIGFTGIEHYVLGPHLHEYLHALSKKAFLPKDAFTIGETPGVGREMGKLLTDPERAELNLVMSFDHLETPGHDRFDDYAYDLEWYKQYRIAQSGHVGGRYWQPLFFDNHDNPRMISKVDPEPRTQPQLGMLLNALLLTGQGTPMLYQGQELGMVNADFKSIEELRDVESLNMWQERVVEKGEDPKGVWQKIVAGTRDHARIPMIWDDTPYNGFSSVTPWLWTAHNETPNAEQQCQDSHSVLSFTTKLLHLRKKHTTLIYGRERFVKAKRKGYYGLYREGEESFFVEANLTRNGMKRPHRMQGALLLSNYGAPDARLRPYEVNIYRCEGSLD